MTFDFLEKTKKRYSSLSANLNLYKPVSKETFSYSRETLVSRFFEPKYSYIDLSKFTGPELDLSSRTAPRKMKIAMNPHRQDKGTLIPIL